MQGSAGRLTPLTEGTTINGKSQQESTREKHKERDGYTAVRLLHFAAAERQIGRWAKASIPRREGNAGNGRVSRVMRAGSSEILHTRRGAVAFLHLRGIRGSIPGGRGARFPMRHGALGPGDDGISPNVGAECRAGGIEARRRADSEGAGIEAGHAARKRLRRSFRHFL